MLRRAQVDHILRAAAAVTNHDWLRAGINAGVLSAERLRALADAEMPRAAPDAQELSRRLQTISERR